MKEPLRMTQEEFNAMSCALIDILFNDDKLGDYDIIVPYYLFAGNSKNDEKTINMYNWVRARVKVIWKRNKGENWRMPVIVVENNGKLQDFYYNDSDRMWKILSENNALMSTWWREEGLSMPFYFPEQFKGRKTVEKKIFKNNEDIQVIEIIK